MKKLIFLGVLVAWSLGSCNSQSDHGHEGHDHATEAHNHEHDHDHEQHAHEESGHSHDHEGDEHAEAASDEIVMPPAKAQAAGVETGTVEPGSFTQVIKTSGQVLAAQGDERVAVATVAGVVSFKGKVTEGMSVREGMPLVLLSSGNIAEGDPVQKARVAYEVSKKEYERMQALVESRIVSEKDFAQAKQAYENARISYEAVAKNHTDSGQAVTAPIGGYVKSLLVKEGDYVTVGQPLVSITQNRRLFLRADVSEKYYASLPAITSANFCTPYNSKVYALQDLNGRLLSYGKASGEGSYYTPRDFRVRQPRRRGARLLRRDLPAGPPDGRCHQRAPFGPDRRTGQLLRLPAAGRGVLPQAARHPRCRQRPARAGAQRAEGRRPPRDPRCLSGETGRSGERTSGA